MCHFLILCFLILIGVLRGRCRRAAKAGLHFCNHSADTEVQDCNPAATCPDKKKQFFSLNRADQGTHGKAHQCAAGVERLSSGDDGAAKEAAGEVEFHGESTGEKPDKPVVERPLPRPLNMDS